MKELYNRSGEKWPLVVLHNRRFKSLVENPSHRKVVEEWMDKGILYTTPSGSNDDWYELTIPCLLKLFLLVLLIRGQGLCPFNLLGGLLVAFLSIFVLKK